jgi:hypothetical protein
MLEGGVFVEWQGEGYYRELEVLAPFMGEAMTVSPGREPLYEEWRWGSAKEAVDQPPQGESVPVWTDQAIGAGTPGFYEAA